MKNVIILLCLLISSSAFSQIKTPAPSSTAKVEQIVGLTTVNLEYSRPNANGRTIFAADGLVPFGKMWRTGANAVTKLTFSDDVVVGGEPLTAGSYALITTPNAERWQFHFYNYESSNWSSYTDKEAALLVFAETQELPLEIETFTIAIQDVTTTGAAIEFLWENTIVSLSLEVAVDEKVMANIEKVMAGPSAGDYYSAASYYHSAGKDLNQALTWITMATDVPEPRFWQVRTKALILADLGKVEEAVGAATQSMELAMKAGNDDYVAMNKKSIAEWTK